MFVKEFRIIPNADPPRHIKLSKVKDKEIILKVLYFAMYNEYFCPNFWGENTDACYTWVVLIPYLFIYAYALKV